MLNRVQKASFLEALRSGAWLASDGPTAITIDRQTYYSPVGILAQLHANLGKHKDGSWNTERAEQVVLGLIGEDDFKILQLLHQVHRMPFKALADMVEINLRTRD